ncbi:MAG: hypothetical protein Q8P50_12060, partial [Bacillota bacterium]|nr:hypothetical protein [Bacillota bacterium]
MRPSSKTMQELAIIYAKRAVQEARNDPADAKTYFASARLSAADSAIASRNLSISLFNDAVAESRAGRDDLAIVLLKESSLAYMDASAFELMG